MTEAEWRRTANAERMFNRLTGQRWGSLLGISYPRPERPVSPRKLFFLFEHSVRLVEPLPPRMKGEGQTEDRPVEEWLGDGGGDDGIYKYASRAVRGERNNPGLASGIRCVIGNPFRPVTLNPSWLTSPVVSLARSMYDNRDFAPMPILADALQDAGCDNADVLDHCRGGGPHVRGCWVVDLILGKQ